MNNVRFESKSGKWACDLDDVKPVEEMIERIWRIICDIQEKCESLFDDIENGTYKANGVTYRTNVAVFHAVFDHGKPMSLLFHPDLVVKNAE